MLQPGKNQAEAAGRGGGALFGPGKGKEAYLQHESQMQCKCRCAFLLYGELYVIAFADSKSIADL